jgi:hypothetical protein
MGDDIAVYNVECEVAILPFNATRTRRVANSVDRVSFALGLRNFLPLIEEGFNRVAFSFESLCILL